MKEWTYKLKIVAMELKQAKLKGLKVSMREGIKRLMSATDLPPHKFPNLKEILDALRHSEEITKIY